MVKTEKILLCVLDWGLGHATRSLALAEQLLADGKEVHWASSGHARAVLLEALPSGTIVHQLPSYNVSYPTANMPVNVALQLPKWIRIIIREHRRTKCLVAKLGIDRIISDNRFGCYHPEIPSVMLTHQLHPITGSRPVSWLYRRYLQRFSEFWVPDFPDQSLSGKLSDSRAYKNVLYTGPLSRLKPGKASPDGYDTIALLSGPEPMRSRLEEELYQFLQGQSGQHLIIRGIPSECPPRTAGNLTVIDYADRDFLSAHLPAASHIICRPGYSTLMDLAALKIKAPLTLVPTPGQTEQIYLAETRRIPSAGRVTVKTQGSFTQLSGR